MYFNLIVLADFLYQTLMMSNVNPMILLDVSYQNLMFSIVNPIPKILAEKVFLDRGFLIRGTKNLLGEGGY